MATEKCPPNYRPGCSCSVQGLEPNEDCYVHGFPDKRQCPFCGQFRGYVACKRCGCQFGLTSAAEPVEGK